MFLISTTLVAVFKRESERGQGKKRAKETQGVLETYKLLFSIIKLPTVLSFCTLLLTAKVPPHHPSRVPLTTHCTLSVAPHGPFSRLQAAFVGRAAALTCIIQFTFSKRVFAV